jgi:thiosulfate/3-mercaptopyruvate sulfurtransferase
LGKVPVLEDVLVDVVAGARVSDVEIGELALRLGEKGLVILDVRSAEEYGGLTGYPCDPRQGHIPGALNVDVRELATLAADATRARVGAAPGTEVIVYCHSGQRSSLATHALEAAGYRPRNFVGSWHAWSNDPTLPVESSAL